MIRAERKRGRYPLKGNTKHLSAMIFVFTVIAIAYACRMLAKFDIGGPVVNHIRTALYLLLFSLWGFSLDRRIIQRQALHCLRLTAALILLWLILRTLKYSVVTGLTAARYVWYLYYLPMPFLPLLGVYIALSLGKPEDSRLSRRSGMLLIVPAVLFLLVITNDLHQQVFAFQSGVPGLPLSGTYSHRPLYYVCLVWMLGCMVFSLVCLFRKSRMPGGRGKRITPFVLGCVTALYGLLYLSGIPAVRWWLGDMNVVFCLLYAAIYESCIHCRMIPSNTGVPALSCRLPEAGFRFSHRHRRYGRWRQRAGSGGAVGEKGQHDLLLPQRCLRKGRHPWLRQAPAASRLCHAYAAGAGGAVHVTLGSRLPRRCAPRNSGAGVQVYCQKELLPVGLCRPPGSSSFSSYRHVPPVTPGGCRSARS